ncbi:gp101 [Bacillus phage G]|uniref:Gp101 n=1 Tax=Bacillus phage G TaxID=2884420 RepID=G3MBG3_9CAUD|nr:gp101 [Bacillus phage G]AEO93363.1 gp101 [Bacillus phage G]
MDELLHRRATKNLEEFKCLQEDLRLFVLENGKDPDVFMQEFGKLYLDEITPEKIQEIMDRI